MEKRESLREMILSADGRKKAPLVLKSARVLNVFTEELETADVAVWGGHIVGVGTYCGDVEVDLTGKIICPGFVDGHIHLESSIVSPREFERAVLPHGTTTVITDPHEIANVAGTDGICYMLETTRDLVLDVFFMLPSCVPATGLDESGARLGAEDLKPFYQEERVLGLAELMNAYGTVSGDEEILSKLLDVREYEKLIDGHAPGVFGRQLNAYAAAGVRSDHECSDISEAMEKLRRGQWIMIRQGTAAKNLEALMPLCREPYYQRCMFVTDDKHPGDLLEQGHIDGIIRRAIALGADPVKAIRMGSFHTAQYFGLKDRGAVAPGYRADLVVLSDLEQVTVHSVYKDGKLAAEGAETGHGQKPEFSHEKKTAPGHGKETAYSRQDQQSLKEAYPRIYQSFHLDPIVPSRFSMTLKGDRLRVIWLTPGELLTEERIVPSTVLSEKQEKAQDIVKMAVLERHKGTGHIGIGFVGGYGLKKGAIATSVAHDSHNLIVAGTSDMDMALAAETVRKNQGGLAIALDGKVLGQLPLPIGGLMTPEPAKDVELCLAGLKKTARELGVPETIDPFMTLAFVSLPVIPKLRLNTLGLIDVEKQQVVPVSF